MPRPDAIPGADGLPLWDTVEVLYFLVTGFSVGLVLGFLFPSLWRAFRRSFRKPGRFGSEVDSDIGQMRPAISVLKDEPSDTSDSLGDFEVESGFVMARACFQTGRFRDAVRLYLSILGSEKVSKEETNRALYELAQTHLALGLQSRAFDTGMELLNRKPEHREALLLLLEIVDSGTSQESLEQILRIWRGKEDDRLRKRISHSICKQGENHLQPGNFDAARNIFLKAARRDLTCGRARVELWRLTSIDAQKKCGQDLKKLWSALAADLEARVRIGLETGISHAAGREVLADWLEKMTSIKGYLESLAGFREEFLAVLGGPTRLSPQTIQAVDSLLAHACATFAVRNVSREQKLEALSLAKAISATVAVRFPQLEILGNAILDEWSKKSLNGHTCQTCSTMTETYVWKCPGCGNLESMVPHLLPVSLPQQ